MKSKLLHLHIPKTAGMSIRSVLKPVQGFKSVTHVPMRIVAQKHDLSDYLTVTVVRNPWERTYSCWNYFTYHLKSFPEMSFEKFVMEYEQNKQFRAKRYIMAPQWWYMTIDDEIAVDEILFFDNLKDDWTNFALKYGYEPKLPVKNTFKPFDYRKVYNDDMVKMIAEQCKKEIEYFKFEY